MSTQRHGREDDSRLVFLEGLVLREGKLKLRCVVLEISNFGARLAVEDPTELPELFTLAFTERGVPRRHCRIDWRNDTQVGVTFDSQKAKPELTPGA